MMFNSKLRNYLFFLGIVALAVLAFSISADDSEARLCVWDGGDAGALASTSANWDADTAPMAGDSILFDGLNVTGDDACTWDLSLEFGTFTIGVGYSGTVTLSTDLHITGFTMTGGTFAPNTKNVYDSGIWSATGGSLTSGGKIHLTGNSNLVQNKNYYPLELHISGYYIYTGTTIFATGVLNITGIFDIRGTGFFLTTDTGMIFSNTGEIRGTQPFKIRSNNADAVLDLGLVNTGVTIYTWTTLPANRCITLADDTSIGGVLTMGSNDAAKTMTLNLAGYDLNASSIVIVARGILTNSAATISEVNCTTLDASNAAGVFNGTSINLNLLGGGSLKVKATDRFKNVTCYSDTISLVGTANITGDLVLVGLTASHPHGFYINGTRTSSITTTSSGTYSLGSGVFAWDNAALKITPVITFDGWIRTDALRNVVWEGYDYWADHDADAVVSWTLSGTSWLSTDANGNITGEAGDDGTYTYTLTATAANGEVASVSGWIIVEDSVHEGLVTVDSWLTPLIGLAAIGFLAVALSGLSGAWGKKK